MKKLLQGVFLPFTLFSFVIVMIGCDPSFKNAEDEQNQPQKESAQTMSKSDDSSTQSSKDEITAKSDLKTGNFFYIARDVADLQMNAGGYISELKLAQDQLQQAIESQNQQQLQSSASSLQTQLTSFNQALINLDLKSKEIDDIRENIVTANTQVLKSPLMNGDVDFSKVDFQKLKQQMGSVQNEMLKLAAMMIPASDSNQADETDSNS